MSLLDYIPFGKDNAISRAALAALAGLNDRAVREQISQLRRDHVIINDQSGKGYYRSNDPIEIERFIKQESARARSIFWSLKAARKALKEVAS